MLDNKSIYKLLYICKEIGIKEFKHKDVNFCFFDDRSVVEKQVEAVAKPDAPSYTYENEKKLIDVELLNVTDPSAFMDAWESGELSSAEPVELGARENL